MTLHTWLAFVATSCIVLAMPGPTAFVILRYAAERDRGMLPRVIAGAVLGDAVALTICSFGLGALLAASSSLLTVLKVVAAAYLVGLGLMTLFDRVAAPERARPRERRPFVGVFLVTALNPKGIVFFCALLPQFVTDTEPALPQLALLQATFCLLSLAAAAAWALAGTALCRVGGRLLRRATGFGLIGAGLAQASGRFA